jgi:hypothetical protein
VKTALFKIISLFVLTIAICETTISQNYQMFGRSQQNFTKFPYRIIINFGNNISNNNFTIIIDSLKSESLRELLCSRTIKAVYSNRYFNGKLKPEFKQCEDGGWYMIESNNRSQAKELIALLQHHESIKEVYLEEPILMIPSQTNSTTSFPYTNHKLWLL